MKTFSLIVIVALLIAAVGTGCDGSGLGGGNNSRQQGVEETPPEETPSKTTSVDVNSYFGVEFVEVYGSGLQSYLHVNVDSGLVNQVFMTAEKRPSDGGTSLYGKEYFDTESHSYGEQYFSVSSDVGVFIVGGRDASGNEYRFEPGIPVLLKDVELGKEYSFTTKRIQGDDVQEVAATLRIDLSDVMGETGTYDNCYRSTLVLTIGSTTVSDVRWYAEYIGLVRREYRGTVSFDMMLNYKIYEEDFNDGPSDWYTVSGQEHDELYETWEDFAFAPGGTVLMSWAEDDGDGYVESVSPWWVDPHHRPPGGYGYLNLLGWTWFDAYRENSPQGLKLAVIDLTDAILEFNVQLSSDLDLKGAHIVFWFQVYRDEDPVYSQYVNYALTAYPIELLAVAGEWTQVTLPLKPFDSDWTCMGAAVERSGKYGCVPVADAMREVNADFGFIAIPLSDPNDPPTGSIKISKVKISYRR